MRECHLVQRLQNQYTTGNITVTLRRRTLPTSEGSPISVPLCKLTLANIAQQYYEHATVSVFGNDTFKIYLDRSLVKDKSVIDGRVDGILFQNINKIVQLIDIAFSLR
jgi:hypothetical protein